MPYDPSDQLQLIDTNAIYIDHCSVEMDKCGTLSICLWAVSKQRTWDLQSKPVLRVRACEPAPRASKESIRLPPCPRSTELMNCYHPIN